MENKQADKPHNGWFNIGAAGRSLLRLGVISWLSLTLITIAPAQPAHAATRTWDGGGGDDNWSTCANWSSDICPVAADTVVFNSTSTKNSIVDASFGGTITTININSGYTGTITMARSLIVSTSFTQATGTFTAANQTLDMNGSFTLTGGIFTASSGATSLAGAMTISGSPTFNHNSGTWQFDGVAATLSCGNVTFNLVQFVNAGGLKTINSNCTLPLGNNPSLGAVNDPDPDFTVSGTLTGSGTIRVGNAASSNVLTLNSSAALSGFTGLDAGALTTSSATVNFGSFTTFTIGSAYSQTGGTITVPNDADFNSSFTLTTPAVFNAPSGTMKIGSNFTIGAGSTFNHNSGTLEFDSNSSATLSCNNTTFNLVRFTNGSQKTVSADCTMPLGTDPDIGPLLLNGTLSGSGTADFNFAGLTVNGTGALSGFSGLITITLTISGGANLDLTGYSTVDLGTFSLTSGSVTAPSGTMEVGGAFQVSGGTFNHNNGTVLINDDSSFTHTISGSNTFNNFTYQASFAHSSITFTAGTTQTIVGTFTVSTSSTGNYTDLFSTVAGSTWNIDPQGSRNISDVRIKDSTNLNATPISTTNSWDEGNNTGWLFDPPTFTGYAASDVLGQSSFSQYGAFNGAGSSNPNAQGFNYPQGTAVDPINHRLFTAECGRRVLVFNLDNNNNLVDKTADYVLGQPDFTSNDTPGPTQSSLDCAVGPSYDPNNNRLFVVNTAHSRVLVYDLSAGITNGMNATYVLGQPDFTSSAGGVTQSKLSGPYGGSLYDATTNYFYIADSGNERILVYDLSAGITNGMNATYVLGQPDFTTGTGSPASQTSLDFPYGLALDTINHRLFVADTNGRVMIFDTSSLANGMNASHVLGVPDFTSGGSCTLGPADLCFPTDLAYDSNHQRLFVYDDTENRILVFDVASIDNGEAAIAVIGQADFNSENYECLPDAKTLCDVEGLSDYYDIANDRLYISDSSFNRVLLFEFIQLPAASLAEATEGESYSEAIAASRSQGTVSYSKISGTLPPGLSLHSATGNLTGTPTSAGTYTFTVKAVDDIGDAGFFDDTQSYTIVVEEAPSDEDDPPVSSGGSSTTGTFTPLPLSEEEEEEPEEDPLSDDEESPIPTPTSPTATTGKPAEEASGNRVVFWAVSIGVGGSGLTGLLLLVLRARRVAAAFRGVTTAQPTVIHPVAPTYTPPPIQSVQPEIRSDIFTGRGDRT